MSLLYLKLKHHTRQASLLYNSIIKVQFGYRNEPLSQEFKCPDSHPTTEYANWIMLKQSPKWTRSAVLSIMWTFMNDILTMWYVMQQHVRWEMFEVTMLSKPLATVDLQAQIRRKVRPYMVLTIPTKKIYVSLHIIPSSFKVWPNLPN